MNIEEYERGGRAKYESFAKAVRKILDAAIKAEPGYRLQQIQFRAKEPDSVRPHLEKAGATSSDKIEDELKDLAGCRVIFYTNADTRAFRSSDILRENFKIDFERTKIHHPVPGTASAERLFMGDNVVVQLNDERAAQPEYAQFRGMRCEIQIQTTLNHAWSEMEHDVYKIKPAGGFGKDLVDGIQKRFNKVAREMLIPAGYEFQKIVDDYARLVSGKELFDKNAMKLLAESRDNNERHELLEKFKAYVLPHLDDPAGAHVEIRATVVAAMQVARTTAAKAISTEWGELPGKTSDDIAELATSILDELRYLGADAVQATLDALCELFGGAASEKERTRILKSVKTLAAHSYEVWQSGGPIVQDILVSRIREWDVGTLEALRPVALVVLHEALRPDVSGTSATYKAVTLTTADVVASDALGRIRTLALDLLEVLFRSATTDRDRREVKQALLDATRFPRRGAAAPALKLTILLDSGRIVRFFGSVAGSLSHQLLENIENRLLWLYRHTKLPADAPSEDGPTAAARQALIDAIFAFRDQVNANRNFTVYKALVGFESVFPPEWEGNSMDIAGKEAYRKERLSELAGHVDTANADDWLKVLQECASTKSDDVATFIAFDGFLVELARTKPEIVESYLERLGDDLANFLPPLLHGLEGTARWPAVQERIASWVSQHRYLRQIIFLQRRIRTVDWTILERALDLAIADGDDHAVMIGATVCAIRSDQLPREKLGPLFVATIRYFKAKGNAGWAGAIWAFIKDSLVDALTDDQIDMVLSALVPRKRIDTAAEWVLAVLAKRGPEKIIDFFEQRLRQKDDGEALNGYEAVPYSFEKLVPHLAATAPYLLSKSRTWHAEDRSNFEYGGGRLVGVVFPELTPELEKLLKEALAAGGDGTPLFVADVLRAYGGAPATHELYKMIVAAVPDGDPALASVEHALTFPSGVVNGEFGLREAYQRKKADLELWLNDPRPRVKAFAATHVRMLEGTIAGEQRRSEEDLEARKRMYGDDSATTGGA